eukprot:1187379-Prorocentrum_minimum.AAC.1
MARWRASRSATAAATHCSRSSSPRSACAARSPMSRASRSLAAPSTACSSARYRSASWHPPAPPRLSGSNERIKIEKDVKKLNGSNKN